jgi:tetratricopeptide (TPR) repeat protein
LFALLRNRMTGTVTLHQVVPEPGTRTIWLRGGMPIFTDWTSPPDVLGEVLMAKAMVGPGAFEQGLTAMARDGGLLGQVLLDSGSIDQRTLAEALRAQCSRKLVHTFALKEGVVTVEAVEHGKGKADELVGQVNVLRLILHGVTKHYDDDRIRTEMGADLRGALQTSPAFPKYATQFGFRSEDHVILKQLQRGTTMEAMTVPGMSRKRIAQVVFTAWACQMLATSEEAKQAAANASAAPPQATPTRQPAAAEPAKPAAKPAVKPAAKPAAAVPKTPPKAPPKAAPAKAAPEKDAPPVKPAKDPRASRPPQLTEDSVRIPKKMLQRKPSAAGAETEFEKELGEFEQKIADKAHAFTLFDLSLDAGRKEIRARWAELSGKFHPDRLEADGLGHLHDRVEPVFASLSEAQGVLTNKGERESLKNQIESGVDPAKANQEARVVVRNALEAEMIARDADKLLKSGHFGRALADYERALALHPGEAEIQAAAAWCRFQVEGRSIGAGDTALNVLAEAIENQPKCARAHYYHGLILLQRKDEAAATASFRSALQADRHFTDAERQLRAINLRKKAAQQAQAEEPKKKGGLRGLFGKK